MTMKSGTLRPKASDMLDKSEYIAHHSLRQMLEVEQYTDLLESVFLNLKKHPNNTDEKRALSAIARSLAAFIVITMHAACFDLTKSRRHTGRRPKPSVPRIMRGDKASFCDAVVLLEGTTKKTLASRNLAIKRRVAYDAKWKNWKPFLSFKEEDGTDTVIPFPVFDGQLSFNERIENQREAQRKSIEDWKKLRLLKSFVTVKRTRDNLYAHLNPNAFNDHNNISSFRDVIDLVRKSLSAMRHVCKTHFGMHRELNSVKLSDAFAMLMDSRIQNINRPSGQSGE